MYILCVSPARSESQLEPRKRDPAWTCATRLVLDNCPLSALKPRGTGRDVYRHMHACTPTNTHAHTHSLTHMHKCTCICTRAHAYTHVHVYAQTHILTSMHLQTQTHAHTYSYMCQCTCTHVHTHSHRRTPSHENTREHTYANIPHTHVSSGALPYPRVSPQTQHAVTDDRHLAQSEGGELTLRSLWTTPIWWQWRTASRICWMQ